MVEITTIKLSRKNKERLEKLRVYKRESYDEMIQRILDLLNLCRVAPERAQHRLIFIERQTRKGRRDNSLGEIEKPIQKASISDSQLKQEIKPVQKSRSRFTK